MVLLLVFMQLTRDLFAIAKFLYYYWKRSQIVSFMTKYWSGRYLSCLPKQIIGGHVFPIPGSAYMLDSIVGSYTSTRKRQTLAVSHGEHGDSVFRMM